MPKTYKTEIIGYKFNELSQEVKIRLYDEDWEFSNMVDFIPLEEGFREMLSELYGADPETLEIYSDVSYSQGSGACCVGDLDVETVIENRVGSYFTNLLNHIDAGSLDINSISIVRCGPSNFYCHENTCRVNIDYTFDTIDVDEVQEKVISEEMSELEEMLTNAIREELCTFYSKLQDYYEDSTSFEAYCEAMNNSDAIYTEEGQVVDPVFIRNANVYDGYQLKLDFEDQDNYNFT